MARGAETMLTEEELEKLKKAHPLVTDYRCFIFEWWPV